MTLHARPRLLRWWTCVCVSGALLQLVACRKDPVPRPERASASGAAAGEARPVTLAPVTETPIDQTIEISGTLDADEQVTVSAKVPGRLASIAVDLASPVERNQVIAKLETTDYQLRVEQAAAALAQSRAVLGLSQEGNDKVDVESTAIVRQAHATVQEAQANLRRARSLSAEGLATGGQLDAAEAAAIRAESALQSAREEVRIREASVRQRRSEVSMAQQQLADTVVRAPIDGIVQAKKASVGAYLAAGAPVVDIVRIDPLRLRVALPERDAALVRQGQIVRVKVQGDDKAHEGTVARLAPALDPHSRTLLVETDIQNPGGLLRTGTLVTAHIVLTSKPSLTVPTSAIVQFAGLSKVITVVEGKAREKQVTTGTTAGDRTEIVSGLAAGDSVVVKPGALQQGQAVRVVEGG